MNYREWSETVESEAAYNVGHETTRDVYTLPNKLKVFNHTVLPWNIFKKSYTYTALDYTIKDNGFNHKILAKYNAKIVSWYHADGYGMPQFVDIVNRESLEICFDFVNSDDFKQLEINPVFK